MKEITCARTSRWMILCGCLSLCAAGGVALLLRPTALAPVTILREPYSSSELLRDRLCRWVPATPSWGWLWHFQEAVFGRRKSVNVSVDVFTLAYPPSSTPSGFSLGEPSFTGTNGLQVWVLALAKLEELRKRFEEIPGNARLCRPRVSTGDGIDTSLFQGQQIVMKGFTNDVGLAARFFPRVRRDFTDLVVIFKLSGVVTNQAIEPDGVAQPPAVSIETNLNVAAKLQISRGSGMFLLNKGREANQKSIGIILNAL